MAKITTFDRQTCALLGTAIDQALAAVGESFGVQIRRGSGRFSDTTFKLRLECTTLTPTGETRDTAADTWRLFAPRYGLAEADLHRTFRSGGKSYEIVGLNPRARTNPIHAKNTDNGRVYLFPAEDVRRLLAG